MGKICNFTLSTEDRLRGLAYQFLKLYERWSEDRQALNTNMSYQADVLKKFTEQLKSFESLEPQVRRNLVDSIQQSTRVVSEEIGRTVSDSASSEIKKTVRQLQESVNEATKVMSHYQNEIQSNFLKTTSMTILTAIVSSIIVSVLVALAIMPKPVLPITGDMLNKYNSGLLMEDIWPKLSNKERKEIHDISLKDFGEKPPLVLLESAPAGSNSSSDIENGQ